MLAITMTLVMAMSSVDANHEDLHERIAIQDLIIQYAYRWDAKDADGFADLFTEDAVLERWAQGALKSRIEGKAAILAYSRKSHQGRLADRQTRHHMSGVVFKNLTESSAVTENMVLITHQIDGQPTPQVVSSGIYRNSWRKTEGGWKIANRVLMSDRK